MGEGDYVWEAVNSLGKPGGMIRGIKAQPGRVTSLGIVNDKPIVMLPGHIQSTLVGFYMLLLPLIRLMSGVPSTIPHPTLRAKMSQRILLKEFAPFQRIRKCAKRN